MGTIARDWDEGNQPGIALIYAAVSSCGMIISDTIAGLFTAAAAGYQYCYLSYSIKFLNKYVLMLQLNPSARNNRPVVYGLFNYMVVTIGRENQTKKQHITGNTYPSL